MRARTWTLGLLASGLAVTALASWLSPTGFARPRNVVLISLDTLRADHLGLYGYHRDTSPRLEAFAERAFVFERALAPAPHTPPSQMSLMTSLYPLQHGYHPQIVERLRERWERRKPAANGRTGELDEETRRHLEDLGYLQ